MTSGRTRSTRSQAAEIQCMWKTWVNQGPTSTFSLMPRVPMVFADSAVLAADARMIEGPVQALVPAPAPALAQYHDPAPLKNDVRTRATDVTQCSRQEAESLVHQMKGSGNPTDYSAKKLARKATGLGVRRVGGRMAGISLGPVMKVIRSAQRKLPGIEKMGASPLRTHCVGLAASAGGGCAVLSIRMDGDHTKQRIVPSTNQLPGSRVRGRVAARVHGLARAPGLAHSWSQPPGPSHHYAVGGVAARQRRSAAGASGQQIPPWHQRPPFVPSFYKPLATKRAWRKCCRGTRSTFSPSRMRRMTG